MPFVLLACEVPYLYENIELGNHNRYGMLLDYCFQKQWVFSWHPASQWNFISWDHIQEQRKESKGSCSWDRNKCLKQTYVG